MRKAELVELVNNIIGNNRKFGLEVYVCISTKDGIQIKKVLITDNLQKTLDEKIISILKEKYLNEIEIECASDLADNKNALYDFELSTEYDPFAFLNTWANCDEKFDAAIDTSISGFAFKFNFNDNYFWAYQHVYPMSVLKKSKNVYAMIGNNKIYDVVNKDLIAIASRIDLIVVHNHVITAKTTLMQNKFGYDVVIRNEAQNTIDHIVELGMVSNPEKLLMFAENKKLTNAKKLMKAKTSPILHMEKNGLIRRIQLHERYKDMVTIKDGKIVTNTIKDIQAFLKLLNDDIVKSELSDVEYDSSSKKVLKPIETIRE